MKKIGFVFILISSCSHGSNICVNDIVSGVKVDGDEIFYRPSLDGWRLFGPVSDISIQAMYPLLLSSYTNSQKVLIGYEFDIECEFTESSKVTYFNTDSKYIHNGELKPESDNSRSSFSGILESGGIHAFDLVHASCGSQWPVQDGIDFRLDSTDERSLMGLDFEYKSGSLRKEVSMKGNSTIYIPVSSSDYKLKVTNLSQGEDINYSFSFQTVCDDY